MIPILVLHYFQDLEMATHNQAEMRLTRLMLRGTMQIPFDRTYGTSVRMYLVPWNSSQGVPDSNSFYHNISGNKFLDPIDSDGYPRLKFMGTLNPLTRGGNQGALPQQSVTIMFKKWIPMKKVIRQRFDGTTINRIDNLKEHMSLIFVPYEKMSSLETDRIVTHFECTATLYYKDP